MKGLWQAFISLLGFVAVTLAAGAPQEAVRLTHVVPIVSRIPVHSDALDAVTVSIENDTGQALESVHVQVIVRNAAGEIIHSESPEITFPEPLPAGGITQHKICCVFVRGYRTSRGDGSVEVRLLGFQTVR